MRTFLVAAAAALAVALPVAASAGGATVRLGHSRIEPKEVTIAPGDSVIFLNEQEMPGGHSVTADDGSFKSPPLAKGETWTRIFEKPGTHAYHITEHPDAEGTIVVR